MKESYILKRPIDVAGAAVGLVLLWPVILAAILAIRATSSGPGIFSQERVGKDEAPFLCRKLRTMFAGTESVPTHEVPASRVTPLGQFLRRTKLDELPQLWNVLKGEMSLVGPRPCLPTQTALVEARRRLGVTALRPGITGLAQVRGIDMADPEALAGIDAEYLSSMSLALDLRILVRTIFGGGSGL
ncbi:MAG: lipid carrier--UDP-N-acetylgalactosaminyltransferase [Rhizobiales bacterium 65-79]|jgi:O-antigen biosynthesis protein WbqP|nr:sugar transferase [Hyphomicrobiales bacterium]OJU01928.1 MAG: lipid carrier--UDP-N-acetylgalactosaminyltransferase [Rhizobiales bacterium 65-79]